MSLQEKSKLKSQHIYSVSSQIPNINLDQHYDDVHADLDANVKKRAFGIAEFIYGEMMTPEKPKPPWGVSETFLCWATGMDRAVLSRESWSFCDQSATFSATQKK